jgi:hypothetical protein
MGQQQVFVVGMKLDQATAAAATGNQVEPSSPAEDSLDKGLAQVGIV